MQDLNGTVTLITGASGALGRAVVARFARAGSRLALVDRVAPSVAPERTSLTYGCDLTDPEATAQVVEEVVERLGRLDHVLHLVGGFSWQAAESATIDDYVGLFDINVRTLFCVGRAVLPVLRAQGTGLLAGVSSGQAWRGAGEGVALYAASKAAVATWLRSVDLELAGTDVKTTVLYPMGIIDTPANRSAMPEADPAGWIDPDDLAEALWFAASTSRRARLTEIPVHPGRL
jgi:NAD(P)-dependent dehydrogenase (short-subunit alcohol dehydrogenase family)